MDYFGAVLNQVLIFTIIIIIGFFVVKTKFLPQSVLPSISILFARIIVPAILFVNTVNGATREDMSSMILLSVIIAIIYVFVITIMRIMPKILRLKGNRASLFSVSFTFGNIGFVGLPLLLAIFGQRAMVYVSMFAVVDLFLIFTYGYLLTFPADNKMKFTPKTLLNMINPPIIAVALSFTLVFLDVRVPAVIINPLSAIANAGMALPFIFIGGTLATMKSIKLLGRYEFFVGILLKMMIIPVCIFITMRAFGIDFDMSIAASLMFGLPTITIIPMLASAHGSDEEYATAAVLLTTIACLFTLTFVAYMITVVL